MFLRILLRRISGKVNNLEIAVLLQKLLRHRPLVPPRIVPQQGDFLFGIDRPDLFENLFRSSDSTAWARFVSVLFLLGWTSERSSWISPVVNLLDSIATMILSSVRFHSVMPIESNGYGRQSDGGDGPEPDGGSQIALRRSPHSKAYSRKKGSHEDAAGSNPTPSKSPAARGKATADFLKRDQTLV